MYYRDGINFLRFILFKGSYHWYGIHNKLYPIIMEISDSIKDFHAEKQPVKK